MMNQDYESELKPLLDTIFSRTGYDFSQFALRSIRRRLDRFARLIGLDGIANLERMVHADERLDKRMLNSIAVPTTSMFRDPDTFHLIRMELMPQLRENPLRIWSAGCSSGEEAYSLAILLIEQGLYQNCRIYATDFNEDSLNKARAGIYSSGTMQKYTSAYLRSGGESDFSKYYSAAHGLAAFHDTVKSRITFAHHNLSSDASFNQFDLILCRNVLIYFNRALQERVLRLLAESLNSNGFLILGNKETLSLSFLAKRYEKLRDGQGVYRRLN